MELHFTDKEKIEILMSHCYTVETVKSWYSQSAYHNDIEYFDRDVQIKNAVGEWENI